MAENTFREPIAVDNDFLLLISLLAVLGISALKIAYEIFFRADPEERTDLSKLSE